MYKIYAIVIGILWKAAILLGLINLILRQPYLTVAAALLAPFVFLDLTFWQAMWQLLSKIYVKIAHRPPLPSKDNYTCKADYILPFTGKWTVFNGGVDKEISHSWGEYSQRYAYDFIILDDEGKSFAGDNTSVDSYFCYDKDVIAPADGQVVKVSKRHKDSRVNGTKVYCDTWDIRGNFIVIKHAEDEYSVVAHLAPGSITVSVGDSVRQGEVIAKCGNTGNTSEPHLHFQLQTGKSFFTSAGLPIAFNGINAVEKVNYNLADTRPCEGNLQHVGDKIYIGRGLEVENRHQP